MAELTFKSPGVSTREIDLSGPTKRAPTGIPAGVIGTADQGRAFVPITVATFADFVAEFGNTDGEKFGPMAMRQWMRYARAGTYFRILGIGDGKKRTSAGAVTNAGFVVGAQEWKANGLIGPNAYAGATDTNPGQLGRTYMFGCIMAESGSSNIFRNAGVGSPFTDSDGKTRRTQPILRGVLMAPSGVALGLSASRAAISNNTPLASAGSSYNYACSDVFGAAAGNNAGSSVGAVNIAGGRQEIVLLLNGHKHTDQYPTVVTASLDPNAPNYFSNVLNTDPTKTQVAGHLLYAHWDVLPSIAYPTGSGLCDWDYTGIQVAGTVKTEDIAFLLTSSISRNGSGDTDVPNFEGFTDRFRTAVSPYIISQKYGGSAYNLFRVHALDDGAIGNTRVKISIENIAKSTNVNQPYGAFDLAVRDYNDTDAEPVVIEKFSKLSLDPGSDRYIARIIGDYHLFYDFDKRVGSQKLVLEGAYPNKSNYIRVETNTMLDKSQLPADVLPVGFRGIQHLVTSGSSIFTLADSDVDGVMDGAVASQLNQYPVPFRQSVAKNQVPYKTVAAELYWGIQFTRQQTVLEPNKSIQKDPSIQYYAKYFPQYAQDRRAAIVGNNQGTAVSEGTVLDCDVFNNDLFSLENIQVVVTTDTTPLVDSRQWAAAQYQRRGVTTGSILDIDGTARTAGASGGSRLLSVENDFGLSSSRRFLKFTTIVQSGFDGTNIFNKDKTNFSNIAVMKEMADVTLQGGTSGPTVATYRKAMDVLKERSDVDIQLLVVPGIRHSSVTDYVMEAVEERFDAVYIMDIEGKDTFNEVISGSAQLASVTNTVNSFAGRNLDNSFAAAYFPDVIMTDIGTSTNVQVPPSVAVLGAFALNDSVAYPWFAPAGFTRGALKNVLETQVKLSRSNLDALYDADINPITAFPQTRGEVVVFGQKTLLAAQSALDRVNVRRLLIDVRRQVRSIGDTFLFEPNRESTLARFAAAVNPILARIQQQQGLDRFKVQIDTTTTSQADVENNIVRGKIFLQPTRSVEFISLDFVVTNAGTEI